MGKADRQAPRPPILFARQIIELAGGMIGNFIVIFQLVRGFANTSAGDAAKVVIPPLNPFTSPAIIRGPAKIGRIDIGGQTLFEAMQLIGPDKMHLSSQACLISTTAQVMGIGRD